MGYSGNHPRFSRKEEMIHDRELIHDAKQQLHRADEAYKSSPANYGTEHNSPVAMTDAASYRSSLSRHWSASNSRFDMPIMHDEAGREGEGSPNMMNSPLHQSKEKEKPGKSQSSNDTFPERRGGGITKHKGKQKYEGDDSFNQREGRGTGLKRDPGTDKPTTGKGSKESIDAAKRANAAEEARAKSDSERVAAKRLGNASAKASTKARAKSDSETVAAGQLSKKSKIEKPATGTNTPSSTPKPPKQEDKRRKFEGNVGKAPSEIDKGSPKPNLKDRSKSKIEPKVRPNFRKRKPTDM